MAPKTLFQFILTRTKKFPSIEHYKLVQQMSIYVSISWFSSPLPFLLDLCLFSRSQLFDIQCHVKCFFTFSDRKLDSACLKSWCRHLHDGHYALLIVMEKSWIHTSLLQGSSLFLWLIIVLFSLCVLITVSTETFHSAFTMEEHQFPGAAAADTILCLMLYVVSTLSRNSGKHFGYQKVIF